MPYTISEIIVLFFTYSVIGWLWETCYCSLKDHHYEYRGFLFGPYCPVYGFAVTTILICTKDVQDHLLLLFIVGVVVATVFEYFASLFLEKVFKMKLWDYSHLWGNIHGRIAPVISFFWGIGVVFLVKVIQPFIQDVINVEEQLTHGWLAVGITIVMGIDTALTMISVERFHVTTKMWDQRINGLLWHLREKAGHELSDANGWRAFVLAHFKDVKLPTLSWNHQRLVKSFPRLRVLDAPKFTALKHEISKKQN
ncbi:putative ABC transporter permease [Limosilactobacillus caecicola]|uniref:putative ABC transporter permease n=1 Tax=Limosilactobacillus caecicola TaxID=2941332 RepID=UPI00203F0B0F|nr:putative ABC transporter permease [Limosilactobacillus caecicola]